MLPGRKVRGGRYGLAEDPAMNDEQNEQFDLAAVYAEANLVISCIAAYVRFAYVLPKMRARL